MTHIKVTSNIGMGFLGIAYNQGGIWESPGKYGTSHLMEHLMCKTFDDLRDQLNILGIKYNAYTSDNDVVFYFSGLEESLEKVGQTLYDRLTKQDVLWDKEGFENEKKTVLQEYGDVFNYQLDGFHYNCLRKNLNYFSCIGLREHIENFTYEDSLEAAKLYKNPRLICEVGKPIINFNSNEFDTSRLPQVNDFGNYNVDLEKVPKENKTIVGLFSKNKLDINLASKLSIVIDCINSGLESPLYTEIRETKGLSYYSLSRLIDIGESIFPLFAASTSNKQASELSDVYDAFFSKKASEVISKERFDICMQSHLVHKKMSEILPHEGVPLTVLGRYNPYANLEDLTYEKALELFDTHLNINNFEKIQY